MGCRLKDGATRWALRGRPETGRDEGCEEEEKEKEEEGQEEVVRGARRCQERRITTGAGAVHYRTLISLRYLGVGVTGHSLGRELVGYRIPWTRRGGVKVSANC